MNPVGMSLAIEVGMLAAFVVVFLPMGMAGLHLTRNRLLFFSIALFIALAVSVHLLAYFPPLLSSFSSSSTSLFGSDADSSNSSSSSSSDAEALPHCAALLHDILWSNGEAERNDRGGARNNLDSSRNHSDRSRNHSDSSRNDSDGSRTDSDSLRNDSDGSRMDSDLSRNNLDGSRSDLDSPRNSSDRSRNYLDSCSGGQDWFWAPNTVRLCYFHVLNRTDAVELLRGSWVMVAGDSEARLFLLSLIGLLLPSVPDPLRKAFFMRHSNYEHLLDDHGIRLSFVWAPYTTDLTDLVVALRHNHTYPDVLVMGNGLWHMLHVTDPSEYARDLGRLRATLLPIFPVSSVRSGSPRFLNGGTPHVFWISIPTLVSDFLNTEEKRQKLTAKTCESYHNELRASRLLRNPNVGEEEEGVGVGVGEGGLGGPIRLLDLRQLSSRCGPACTADGMHYCRPVYEASAQVMLNTLLIDTHQAPSK